jgi:hypothetical protein
MLGWDAVDPDCLRSGNFPRPFPHTATHMRLILSIEKVQHSQAELENLTSCPRLAI